MVCTLLLCNIITHHEKFHEWLTVLQKYICQSYFYLEFKFVFGMLPIRVVISEHFKEKAWQVLWLRQI